MMLVGIMRKFDLLSWYPVYGYLIMSLNLFYSLMLWESYVYCKEKFQKGEAYSCLRRKECVEEIAKMRMTQIWLVTSKIVGQAWRKNRILSTSKLYYSSQIIRSPPLVSLDHPEIWSSDPKHAEFPSSYILRKSL